MFLAHSCTKHRPWLLSFRSEATPIYKALAKYKQLAIVTELALGQFVLCCASESSTERVLIPALMQLWIVTWCLTAKKFRALATRRCVLSSKQSSKMASTVTQSVTSFASPIRFASTHMWKSDKNISICSWARANGDVIFVWKNDVMTWTRLSPFLSIFCFHVLLWIQGLQNLARVWG